MAKKDHLNILRQGVAAWNQWRKQEPEIVPDLSGVNCPRLNLSLANLKNADFTEAYLSESRFSKANLQSAIFREAALDATDFSRADLRKADIVGAALGGAKFVEADLREADLTWADLVDADLTRANLSGANLRYARLVNVNLESANLANSSVYGVSAWNLRLLGADQSNLIITSERETIITVDNLEVAQFIYLLLNNEKIRDVIDTVTSKVVLILGRFTPERKQILDAIRNALRQHDYLPIMFDFEKPESKNLTETISTLAHLARFVIADITKAKSIPQELERIVPANPALPVQPIILSIEYEYGMFESFRDYPWVLAPYRYENLEKLLMSLEKKVIVPAEKRVKEIARRRKAFEKAITNRPD